MGSASLLAAIMGADPLSRSLSYLTPVIFCRRRRRRRRRRHPLASQAVHFRSAHTAHINIARFAHESPNVMATSSFDKTIKVRLSG